jgi:hypothetical protein
MMLSLAVLLAIAASGWAIGRTRPKVDIMMTIMAVFAAVTAQSGWEWAFIEEGFDAVFGDPRRDGGSWRVFPIAACEGAGLWLPVMLVPWAAWRARLLGGVYTLTAATMAAIYLYFPFDLVLIPEALVPPDPPPYILAAFLCAPIAAVPLIVGYTTSRMDADDKAADEWADKFK